METEALTYDSVFMLQGYASPRMMVYLHETFGLHIADQLPELKRRGYKVHWELLRNELVRIGMKDPDSLIAEAKFFERDLGV